MAKITLVFTRPGREYKQQDADALVRDLDGLIEKLNSTFQQELRDESQRFTWFTTSSLGANSG
jgi:predicted GNAT superfamily acetyltransferase